MKHFIGKIVQKTVLKTLLLVSIVIVTVMSGCSGGLPGFATPTVTPSQTSTSTPAPTMTPTMTPSPTPTPVQIMLEGQGVPLQKITAENAEDLERLTQLKTGSGVKDLLFLPDEKTLVVVERNGTIQFWNVQEGSLINEYKVAEGIKVVQYVNGELLYVPCSTPKCISLEKMSIAALDPESGETETRYEFKESIWGLSADGNLVALATLDDISEYPNMEVKQTGSSNSFRAITYNVQYRRFSVEIWDVSSGTPVLRDSIMAYLLLPEEDLPVVNFSLDGDQTVYNGIFSHDGFMRVTNKSSDDLHKDTYAFTSDGKLKFNEQGSAALLNNQTLEGHLGQVTDFAFSLDDSLLATAAGDASVIVWNVEDGEMLQTVYGQAHGFHSVAFSPNGTLLASCVENDTTVSLWGVR